MTRTWIGLAVAAAIFAAGWFGHALANGPPPDVTAILEEAKQVAGEEAQAREISLRTDHQKQLEADSIEDARQLRNGAALVQRLKAEAVKATQRTDAALDLLASQGVVLDEARLALAKERMAREAAAFTEAEHARQEAQRAQRRVAVLVVERDRAYRRMDSLTAITVDLRGALKKASRKGLDPAVTLSYSPGCDNLVVGGSVRVHGWLRGGLHVETRKCQP